MLQGANVLVTGSSRGLGLELVRQMVERGAARVIATCRKPEGAQQLARLAEARQQISVISLDTNNVSTFHQLVSNVQKLCGKEGLNLLVNNAGVAPRFTRIGQVVEEQLVSAFQTNVVGPVLLTQALLPLLHQGGLTRDQDSLVVNMSSILASIEENGYGPEDTHDRSVVVRVLQEYKRRGGRTLPSDFGVVRQNLNIYSDPYFAGWALSLQNHQDRSERSNQVAGPGPPAHRS